jgi:hypothetical protein
VAQHRFARNLAGSLVILATLGGIAYGLPAVDRALPADRPVASGEPYSVGGGVTVVPPPNSMIDVTKTRPGVDRGTALFILDSVRYVIVVVPFGGTLDEAAGRLRRKITGSTGYQVAGNERSVTTAQGIVGRQGSYTAPGRAGRYAVFVDDGTAVEVTVSGSGTRFEAAVASVHSISYRRVR